MKKILPSVLAFIIIITNISGAFAITDDLIFTDPIKNVYTGRGEATQLIYNLNFTDISAEDPALERIVRAGAFNLIKGYDRQFSPNGLVTNQEALAFVLRLQGLEDAAQQAALTAVGSLPPNSPLRTHWSLGYINLAHNIGLITPGEFADAIAADQTNLNPGTNFLRTGYVTRERFADWLVRGLEGISPTVFGTGDTQQNLYRFTDFDSISLDKAASIEKVLRAGIMSGKSAEIFAPKDHLTRSEAAQIMANTDLAYLSIKGYTKQTGTVGGIKDAQAQTTAQDYLTRDVYIRNALGLIDVLRFNYSGTSSPSSGFIDGVVFREGEVNGLASLVEGDEIEYIIDPATGTIVYIEVTTPFLDVGVVQGLLMSVDLTKKQITLKDLNDKTFTYNFASGLAGDDYVIINNVRRNADKLPIGSRVELSLKNKIVDGIKYLGEVNLITEMRGIVTENDPDLGYLTVIDNKGNHVEKFFYEDDLRVKKTQYYDMGNGIGYISELFPNFRYDPRETSITEIEPGDIVFMRLSEDDPDTIESISASTNYIVRFAKILEISHQGDFHSMMVEYENKQTAWFDVPHEIFVSKDGRPTNAEKIVVGDWAKFLLNQAILEPGNILESVKEITVEGDEHFISTIIKGQLSGINAIQNQINVQNVQTLSKTGWSNYKNLAQFSIAGRDIEYYYDGKRISLDYALQYLKRSDGEVYIALENNYTGEKVKKVTFRSERDELLSPDTVVNSDGNGGFSIISVDGSIATDNGTIVRRHGRLVDGHNIITSDYAVVSLNGENRAAVVDITDAPDVSGVMIYRGGILSVDDGKSFTVRSMSLLSGNEWVYSPIQREFTIDYNTIFLDESGVKSSEQFIGYTENSVVGQVYNIITDGARAAYVIKAPYCLRGLRGTIYNVNGNSVSLKNVTYYDSETGKWLSISNVDPSLTLTIPTNSAIVKNNSAVTVNKLEAGDQIKVMTNAFPENFPTTKDGIIGYIVTVEK